MSRRKKRSQTARNNRRQEQKRPSWDVVIQDTAAGFTCSRQIAKDFVAQCDSRLEDLEAISPLTARLTRCGLDARGALGTLPRRSPNLSSSGSGRPLH